MNTESTIILTVILGGLLLISLKILLSELDKKDQPVVTQTLQVGGCKQTSTYYQLYFFINKQLCKKSFDKEYRIGDPVEVSYQKGKYSGKIYIV